MLRIGRLTLEHEPHLAQSLTTSPTSLKVSGDTVARALSADDVHHLRRQLRSMVGQIVPVVWDDMPWEDGFYRLTGADASLAMAGGFTWSLDLEIIGQPGEVDFEAWLITAELYNEHVVAGTFWHSPPTDADTYHTSSETARLHERAGAGGITVPVWLDVDQDAVYSIDPDGWYAAAVSLVVGGHIATGTSDAVDTPADWMLSNDLVRIVPDIGGLQLGSWTKPNGSYSDLYSDIYAPSAAAAWSDIAWDFSIDGDPVTGWDRFTVLHNRPDFAAVRLLRSTAGRRITCDISLRRGSRTAVVVLRADETHQWQIARRVAEGAEEFAAGIIAANVDDVGNRYVAATTRVFTADLVNGAIAREARGMDVALGVQTGSAVGMDSDDLAEALARQYVGYSNEQTTPVRR